MINTPARAFELRNSEFDWGYKTTMIDRPEYTRVEKPNTRGKVLGGSSSLNYYTWVRGSAATFDDWEEFGGSSWNWEGCKEYFDKVGQSSALFQYAVLSRCANFHQPANYHDCDNLFPPELRGGVLNVGHPRLVKELHPFRDALEKGWVSKGLELTEDIYHGHVTGLTKALNTVWDGTRSNSSVFVLGRKNVHILASTKAAKLNIVNDKVESVTVLPPEGGELVFSARKEIIVSCGVFESPKLLMLSGIGPAETLKAHGIQSIVHSAHVGQNLLDHPIMPYVRRLKDGYGLDGLVLRPGPARDQSIAAYEARKEGPLSSGLLELVAFPRVDKGLANHPQYLEAKEKFGGRDPFGPGGQPHFEVDFVPMFCDAFQWHFPIPPEGDWLTVIVDLLRPTSQNGSVMLKSTNPHDQPEVNINFFSNDLDILALIEGVRLIDNVISTGEGIKDIVGEHYPWDMPLSDDAAMRRQILERSQTGFHPCGTLRLGKTIEQGVVDDKLKVHGIHNLRVIDASVFPVIPDCRIQNAVYMVAEKACTDRCSVNNANGLNRAPISSKPLIQTCIHRCVVKVRFDFDV
jgi:choline dehydrogenase